MIGRDEPGGAARATACECSPSSDAVSTVSGECVFVTDAQLSALKPDCRSGAALEQKAEAVAIAKTKQPVGRCFALSVLAGMQIALGATLMLFVKSDANLGFATSQLLGGICFSLGLLCVIVAGAELFTGNALMICAAASHKISWGALAKNWTIVYVGNLAGSLLMVGLMTGANIAAMNGGAVGSAIVSVASSKIGLGWGVIFFRGILCNVLVCLAVWMGFAGRTVIDKVFTTILPVMAFVACGFEHCIANMYFLPMAMATLAVGGFPGDASAAAQTVNIGGAFWNISAATLGNMVGGAVFVGLLYWLAYAKRKQ